MKKLLAFILILAISAAVLCVVGAGVLALAPNKHLFNLPIAFVKVKTDKQSGPDEVTKTNVNLHAEGLGANKNVNFVIDTSSFDVSVEYLTINSGSGYHPDNIYVVMNAEVMGFSTSKDLEIKWYTELDKTTNTVTIKTKQPNGLMFTNRCSLGVFIPRTNIASLKITTDGTVNVKQGFSKIQKLDITSNSNQANNAMVYSPVGEFTLVSPNGSGDYQNFNFEGNLKIKSETGSFKFKQINGNVTAEGTYMNLDITTLNGDLDYKVKYGKGNFTTITKSAKFNSKGTDVVIGDILGSVVVEEGGNSTFVIDQSKASSNSSVANWFKLDKGKLTLKNSRYKTTVNANGGDIKIENARDIVEINPTLKGAVETSKSKPKISVSFADVVANTSNYLLTICSKGGSINATNLKQRVYIESSEATINLQFKSVSGKSEIRAASTDINVKVPNSYNYLIEAEVEDKDYISVDVGGVQTDDIYTETTNAGKGTKTLTYKIGTGSVLDVIYIFTREHLNITATTN